jgi:hypothetical protein
MTPKWLAVVAVGLLFAVARTASAFTVYVSFGYTSTTWTMYAETDAPRGIAALAVNLTGSNTGTSIAPRGSVTGFTLGNIFANSQAFVGQQLPPLQSSATNPVFGIGHHPVPDSAFGTITRGTANVVPVPLYTGTWNQPPPLINFLDPGLAAVFPTAGKPVLADVQAIIPIGGRPDVAVPDALAAGEFCSESPGTSGSLPGDFDMDGDIDGADYVIWETNFPINSGAEPFQGDADLDGDVDGEDYCYLITTVVPEPAAGFLLAVVLGALFCRGVMPRRC